MLRNLDQPNALCGRVFKNGDPTYGCRDCGMDPTCVLCVSCFKSSAHKNHRYKISTSSGGGYCDCGDKEAWKEDVFCDKHIKSQQSGPQSGNILDRVPNDLVRRIRFVFSTILAYAQPLLTDEITSLPSDLQIREWEKDVNNPTGLFDLKDTYVTMLYNDEVHTYDQVIYALEKAIECSNRDAVAYATVIDREGRSLVRCSTFHQCTAAREIMDRPSRNMPSKALKVQVMHTSVVAHQIFASRLLTWLHKVLEIAQVFRRIFSDIACKEDFHLINSIFRSDTKMWKTSRIQWHRLFISGMLMELETKKIFARVFTKCYNGIMKDFIQDDHEHSVGVVSLAVQLFTMPTIAHMLIAEEDVLCRLISTFLSECSKYLKDGKLSLDPRGRSLNTFKRVQYILYDLKYLLGFKPEVWTNNLRKGFLSGFSNLLSLLSTMQGMDPAVRQVGQHMEFEPEWECAFNLHIKLSHVLPLAIEWASSDRDVFIRAFRLVLRNIGNLTPEDMKRRFVKDVLDYSVGCIDYDVSFSPVSLHLPLSRLLAGLMLHLDSYGLNYNSDEFNIENKPTPEELMEPVLRTQVMIAQVNAGMWRRNGFSLNNQIYFYHNVRCRQEMLDRDIMLLQEVASLIDANEFLVHLLNRHNLLQWVKANFDFKNKLNVPAETVKHTTIVAEEFLILILDLVSERYTPNIGQVTTDDCIRNEIIQLLCMESMPHSVLNKSLPENVNHETGMEKVIKDVANFKKVTSTSDSKGYFELKKEYRNNYNLFFYHYTKEDQSKSEVTQRELKKLDGQPVCCPPPVIPPFSKAFATLVNILQCDVFLHIIKTVLHRFQEPASTSVSETMLQIVLHLIGYALHEEMRYVKNDDPYFRFTIKSKQYGVLPLLVSLVNEKSTKTHRDLLLWTIDKYNEVVNLYSDAEPVGDSYVQKFVPVATVPCLDLDKERKSNLAALRRQKIMEGMAKLQSKFIKNNVDLFKVAAVTATIDTTEDTNMDLTEDPLQELIALGPSQTPQQTTDSKYTCILCHQEDKVVLDKVESSMPPPPVMVLGAHVQRSTVLSRNRQNVKHLEEPESHDTLILSPDLCWGVHTTSCGHAMHAQCWQRYFDDVLLKERRKPHRGQNLSFDIEKNEYLCPLCESLCNTALPVLPTLEKSPHIPDYPPFDHWLRAYTRILETRVVVDITKPSSASEVSMEETADRILGVFPALASQRRSTLKTLKDVEPPKYIDFTLPKGNVIRSIAYSEETRYCMPFVDDLATVECDDKFHLSPKALEMMGGFGLATYTLGLVVEADHTNPRVLQMIWASTSYTIHVLEETQRSGNRAMLASVSDRHMQSVTALVKFAAYAPSCLFFTMFESTAIRLLSMVIGDIVDPETPCLLEWDAFSLTVSLTMAMSNLITRRKDIPSGSIQELYILRLCLFSHVVQILITMHEDLLSEKMDLDDETEAPESDFAPSENTESSTNDGKYLLTLLNAARRCLGLHVAQINPTKLFNYVRAQCLPFLRCCGIFFHCLSEVRVPVELQSEVWVPESEFFCLLRYLGLAPHFSSIFQETTFQRQLEIWCNRPELSAILKTMKCRDWTGTNKLISLPRDYSELINTASQFPCPASVGDDSHTPTMCLVCGEVLCAQSYCCRREILEGDRKRMVGACTHHAHHCGAGTGLFLRVRECKVLLLSGRIKGCYVAPPYLDEYGETDQGLKRGNPLHLDDAAYERLHNKWMSHSIPDDIARTMENSNNMLITDWFYF